MIKNPVPWPNGARCAVAFTFDMDADSILHLAHHTSADTRVAAMSMLVRADQMSHCSSATCCNLAEARRRERGQEASRSVIQIAGQA